MQDLSNFISNHPLLVFCAIVLFIAVTIVELMRARSRTFNINTTQMTQKINRDNAVVIDIRQQEVYRKGHIIDAVSLTAQEMKDNPKKLEKFRAKPLIVVCNAGVESQKVAAFLLKQGYNAYSLAGGMRAWQEAQMPIVKD